MRRGLLAGALVVLLALAVTVAVRREIRGLDRPLPITSALVYRVAPGASLQRIAAALHRRGLLETPLVWTMYARWHGEAAALRAGEYELRPGLSARGLLDMFVKGEVMLRAFTIVDGWRVADLLAALRRDPYVRTTLPAKPADLMAKFAEPGASPEGQFLPETYEFARGASDVEVLAAAHRALLGVLDAAWKTRQTGLPLRQPEDLLILASIVEKESALPAERRKIAGLYLHRLAIGMRLQADPSVIYGLGARYAGRLHAVDLHTDGPYNTYTRAGLPPTPIALPGAAAIDACAHPQQTRALYFVASGNGDGRHVFSRTLTQQDAAVRRYLARMRAARRAARRPGGKGVAQ
ncbi:MAG TPA: endolytic transglycosylase MltG [Steroidobacteraceae bacterium]|nr:endolytic transglycosylase MltG [Steroidobacteraceae bacterium]